VYEGEFRNDTRCGKGVYMMATGDCYEGMFRDGVPDGQGGTSRAC